MPNVGRRRRGRTDRHDRHARRYEQRRAHGQAHRVRRRLGAASRAGARRRWRVGRRTAESLVHARHQRRRQGRRQAAGRERLRQSVQSRAQRQWLAVGHRQLDLQRQSHHALSLSASARVAKRRVATRADDFPWPVGHRPGRLRPALFQQQQRRAVHRRVACRVSAPQSPPAESSRLECPAGACR